MAMIDREKVLSVLLKRFPHAALSDVAAAANAIVGLDPEYTPLEVSDVTRFDCASGQQAYSARHLANGEIRVFVKARVAQKV